MKILTRITLALFTLTLGFLPTLAHARKMNTDAAIEQLDTLVQLSSDQKTRARVIFTKENSAIQAFATTEEKAVKGTPIRVQARADIRALLNASQQTIYDRSPQRLGGGSTTQEPVEKLDRIDRTVTLTDAQTLQVAAIVLTETNAIQSLSANDRFGAPGAAIRQTAKAQLGAILNPEQQRKYDANPEGREDLEELAHVREFLKSSASIKARFGDIGQISDTTRSLNFSRIIGQPNTMQGTYTFILQGNLASETLKVYWHKDVTTSTTKIDKIETSSGEILR